MAQSPPWGPPDPTTRVGPTGGRSTSSACTGRRSLCAPGPDLRRVVGARAGAGPDCSSGAGERPRSSASRPSPSSSPVCGSCAATGSRSWAGRWIPTTLRALCIAGLLWALFCYAAAADAALASWPARFSRHGARAAGTLLVVCVAVAALLPGTVFALVTVRQDNLLDTVFAGSGDVQVARPSPLADLGITTTVAPTTSAAVTVATAAPTTVATTVPTTVASTLPPLAPGRWNIALLGGDAGPNRWGLRTDTMIVVSIDRQTGDLASVSVPRNLQHLPMPPGPLRDRFPWGFDDLANALFTYVAGHPELGLDPAQSIKGGLAELLGHPDRQLRPRRHDRLHADHRRPGRCHGQPVDHCRPGPQRRRPDEGGRLRSVPAR